MADEDHEEEPQEEEEDEWPEEEEAAAPEEAAAAAEEVAAAEEEAPPPPPPPAEEHEEEEVVEEEEEVVEEAPVETAPEDRFVVGCEGKEDVSDAERQVEYQAALSMLLLVELQSGDPAVVVKAASKLDNFFSTEEHAAHTDGFCALGGHGLLLMLLQKWQDDLNIQERLFSCLAHLCMWARRNRTDILSTVLIMRGMDLIADSMKRFPDSSQIYVDGLVTITCLCRKEELDRHATTRNSITGAVPLVCKAIKAFPENRNVLDSGCRALKAFCEMKLAEIKDLKGEAISVVGASLQNFPDDREINVIAFSFLRNLGSMCGYDTEEVHAEEGQKQDEKQETEQQQERELPQQQEQPRRESIKPAKKWGGKSQW